MTEASRVQKLLTEQNTEIDRLKNRIEQLEARVEELESIQECACAYDTPTDICAFHKRLFDRITTVRRDRIEQLEAALEDALQYVSRADWHYLKDETRKALEGKDD